MMRPMLASPANLATLRYPLLASPKLDGLRGFVEDGVLLSRTRKVLPNRFVQEILGDTALNGLDGEVVVGPANAKDVYRRTSSGIMSHDGSPNFSFFIFDLYTTPALPYQARLRLLTDRCSKLPSHLRNQLVVLPQQAVHDEGQLLSFEEATLDQGYEGLILRDPLAPYKYGRATEKEGYLLKFKRFEDAEAEVIGFEEEMHNGNVAETNELGRTKRATSKDGLIAKGTLGALVVKDLASHVEFRIGTGFDAAQRIRYWHSRHELLGKYAKYKHFPIGAKDAPRHPVFLGFRDRIDL